MIKIAYVINAIKKGGPSKVLLNLIQNLNREEFDITLITLVKGNDVAIITELKNSGIKVVELEDTGRARFLFFGNKNFKLLLKKEQYDIVHGHGFLPDYLIAKHKTKSKKVTTIHNIMREDYLYTYGKIKGAILTFLHRRLLKKMDLCIGCSKCVYDSFPKNLTNTIYVQNGCDNNKKNENNLSKSDLGIPKNAKIYIYAGALSAGKNIVWLIESFKKHREINEYLLVLGEGEEQQKCLDLRDENIKVLGFKKNVREYYEIADVYISASKSEGFSIAILEALECGLGLFVSNIPSHREIVDSFENCYVGEVFAQDDFNEKIILFRKSFSQDKKEISTQKQKYFSGLIMTQKYTELYKSRIVDIK